MLTVALTAAACGDDSTVTGEEPGGGPSVFGEWLLVDGPVPDTAIGPTTLRVADDGSVGGSTACNSYGSAAPAIDGDRWLATEFFVTEMGCEPARMEAESGYLSLLATMTRVAVTPTGLELSDADRSNLLSFERVVPPADSALVGTTWELESLILGEAVSSTMSDSGDATLVLRTEGSVTGSDGCGELAGSYEIDGENLRMNVTVDLGTACDERFAEQAAHIGHVLGSQPGFTIEGPRLTLVAPDGRGLDYQAAQ